MVDFNGIKEHSSAVSVFDKLSIDGLRDFVSHFLYSYRYSMNDNERPLMYGHEPQITFSDRDRHYGVKVVNGIVHLYYKARLVAKFDVDFQNAILYPFDTRNFEKDDKKNLDTLKKSFRFNADEAKEIQNFFSVSNLYPSLTTMIHVRAKAKKYGLNEKYNRINEVVMNLDYIKDNNWFNDVFEKNKKPYFFLNLDHEFIETVLKYKKPFKELNTKLLLIAQHYDDVEFIINEETLSVADCKHLFRLFKSISDYDNFRFTFNKCSFIDGKSIFNWSKDKNNERIINKLVNEQKNMFDGFYYKVDVK